MNPSMWTSYLIEWTPHDMARCLAEHGWTTAELSDEHGHDLLKLGDPGRVGEDFRRFAAELGLSFPQGHFYLCTKGIRPEDREGRRVADIAPAGAAEFEQAMADMRRWVDLFNALGVKAGVLHIGGGALQKAGWPAERIFERRVAAVRRIAEYAQGGTTRICLENMAGEGSGVRTAAEFTAVLDAVGLGNVAVCLDTGHANLAKIDIPAFIREVGSHLEALHIADNLGQGDDHMLPCGRGTVPWPAVLAALRDVGYGGPFNFEVPGENRCPKPVRLAKLDYALRLAACMTADNWGA